VFTVKRSNSIGSNKGTFTKEGENLFSQATGLTGTRASHENDPERSQGASAPVSGAGI
jgi:hypothetical protein